MVCGSQTKTCENETRAVGGRSVGNTSINKIERKLEKLSSQQHYIGNLIAALGNPSEWVFTGEVGDAGKNSRSNCACGHPIRYIYYIKRPRDGALSQVGSTCIDHFQEINPEMYAALKEAQEKLEGDLAEKKGKAREARQQAEIERLDNEFNQRKKAMLALFEKSRSYGQYFVPNWLRWLFNYRNRKNYLHAGVPDYERNADYIRWYKKQIEMLDNLYEENEAFFKKLGVSYPLSEEEISK